MAKHTEHSILGVIENMSYFESKETGNKEYVFGKGGGRKLADELNTQLLGELPLEQPTGILKISLPLFIKQMIV